MDFASFRPGDKVPVERVMRTEPDQLEYDVRAKRTWAWTRTEKLAEHAANEAIQLAALREFLKRTDPEPSSAPPTQIALVFTWKEPPLTSDSSSSHPALSTPSSSSSDASTLLSATEDSARPFWQ